MDILVTGCAGFIGFHMTKRLINEGYNVIGIDNLNSYYDISLKQARLTRLEGKKNFTFYKASIDHHEELRKIFDQHRPSIVINLAAQAGVRYSLENPESYINSNLVGFANILEECRRTKVKHLIYASTSSVYGANTKMPFSPHDSTEHPISLYAATKKANELMAHSYSSIFGIPTTGLRFFTVYGPWGRPDMALFLFTKAILDDQPLQIFNNGKMMRDFTYIDDVIEVIVRILDKHPKPNNNWNSLKPDPASSLAPYKIYNIGNHNPVYLMDFISAIEEKLGKEAKKEFLPLQPGDVLATYADVDDLLEVVKFQPKTSIKEGVGNFIDWYRTYYKVKLQ